MITIRLAKQEDAKSCAEIHGKSWVFAYKNCVSMETINKYNMRWLSIWEKMLSNNHDSHYVVIHDNSIVGFLTINPTRDRDLPASYAEITGLYLDPSYIGRGIGRQAIEWIKCQLRDRMFSSISLWVLDQNFRAKSFYEKCGFVSDGKKKDSGLDGRLEERYICCL